MKKKRTAVQVPVPSDEYKAELKRCIALEYQNAGVPVDTERAMAMYTRNQWEEKFPSLKAIADQERGASRAS